MGVNTSGDTGNLDPATNTSQDTGKKPSMCRSCLSVSLKDFVDKKFARVQQEVCEFQLKVLIMEHLVWDFDCPRRR